MRDQDVHLAQLGDDLLGLVSLAGHRGPPRGPKPYLRVDHFSGGGSVHRYNAEDVEGLRDRPRPGRPCALDEGRQAALKALVLRGPDLERDGCVAWRARDLCALVEARFGVRYGESGMLELLKGLGLSWQKARPVHPEADPRMQERFKKTCPA